MRPDHETADRTRHDRDPGDPGDPDRPEVGDSKVGDTTVDAGDREARDPNHAGEFVADGASAATDAAMAGTVAAGTTPADRPITDTALHDADFRDDVLTERSTHP